MEGDEHCQLSTTPPGSSQGDADLRHRESRARARTQAGLERARQSSRRFPATTLAAAASGCLARSLCLLGSLRIGLVARLLELRVRLGFALLALRFRQGVAALERHFVPCLRFRNLDLLLRL